MQEIDQNQQKYTRGKGAPCAGGGVVRGSNLINLKKSTAEGFGSCRHGEGVPCNTPKTNLSIIISSCASSFKFKTAFGLIFEMSGF